MRRDRWWPTMSEVALNVRDQLEAGHEDQAFRLLMDGINRLPDAAAHDQLAETITQPPTIGNEKWDTLLAASVRYRLHSMGHRPPAWTFKQPLSVFWWPTRISPSQQYNDMAHTPAEFRRVGIFIDEKEFTSA